MKKKRIISIVLAALLLVGATSAFAASAGSAGDPLISLAYAAGEYMDSVLAGARAVIAGALGAAEDRTGNAAAGSPVLASAGIAAGSVITMKTGSSLTLLSGSAELSVGSGAVVNVTSGEEAAPGGLLRYNRYLACEDTVASVSFTAASVITAAGDFTIEGIVSAFADVTPDKWFFNDVLTATAKGLVNGKTATAYEPYSELTVAEAVKLAACLHQLRSDGKVTLQNSASPWYQAYVDYAAQNGIISDEYTNYNASVTREEFVRILFGAYPASEYEAINSVGDGAIPDVGTGDAYAGEIYVFYRAGILTGDEANFFNPKKPITRSEVAAVLTRMYDASARQPVTLP